MPKVFNLIFTCPYYRKHEATKIYCNCGELSFPDKHSTGSYAVDFCSGEWAECTLAKAWNEHYERKDNEQSRADKKIRNTIKILTVKK